MGTRHILLFCKYRVILVLTINFALWGVSAMVFNIGESTYIHRFHHVYPGMSRTELDATVGEPKRRQGVEAWESIPSETRARHPELVEYHYDVVRSFRGSYLEIGGIYLDKQESQVEFVNLKTSIIEGPGRLEQVLVITAAFGILSLIIWRFLTIICKKSRF